MGFPVFRSVAAMFALALVLAFVAYGFVAPTSSSIASQEAPAVVASNYSAEEALAQIMTGDGVLRFDVAEDGTRFHWDGEPDLVEEMPTAATLYVTQGYIYPEGTLTESNGVLEDGSPEFPDLVLGQWSCYGWWVGDPGHREASAPWLTTHIFNFGGAFGDTTLVSEGYSIDDMNVPMTRAIVGGTGEFVGASGVQTETNLGWNASVGLNFSYELTLETD